MDGSGLGEKSATMGTTMTSMAAPGIASIALWRWRIWEGVEACDDGNDLNNDACVNCAPAQCGDGFIQDGVEACDDGDQNDDLAADACRTNCREAVCGDG